MTDDDDLDALRDRLITARFADTVRTYADVLIKNALISM